MRTECTFTLVPFEMPQVGLIWVKTSRRKGIRGSSKNYPKTDVVKLLRFDEKALLANISMV
jgi:hypothetical protein